MAKDNEKKVSGEMNADELENVAGGWCLTGGKSMPSEVKEVKKIASKDGSYSIITEFKDGSMNCVTFDANGTLQIGSGSK